MIQIVMQFFAIEEFGLGVVIVGIDLEIVTPQCGGTIDGSRTTKHAGHAGRHRDLITLHRFVLMAAASRQQPGCQQNHHP